MIRINNTISLNSKHTVINHSTMITTSKRFPITAGRPVITSYLRTKDKQVKIGYYIMEFTWTDDGALLSERMIKKVINPKIA